MDHNKLEATIKQRLPATKSIRFIDHGYDNIVAIVDEKEVFRFPRNEIAQTRLQYDAQILRLIDCRIQYAPRIYDISHQPMYVTMEFIPGVHLSEERIKQLPQEDQQRIGIELAKFMVDLNKMFRPRQIEELRKKVGVAQLDEPWAAYLKKQLSEASFPDNPKLEDLARSQYQKWLTMYKGLDLPTIVIHDDLHVNNILLKDNKVSGILDFGDTNVGTAAEEMRNIFRLGETVFNSAKHEYEQLTGVRLNKSSVFTWSLTTELGTFCEYLSANELERHSFKRSLGHLKQWIPDFPYEQ